MAEEKTTFTPRLFNKKGDPVKGPADFPAVLRTRFFELNGVRYERQALTGKLSAEEIEADNQEPEYREVGKAQGIEGPNTFFGGTE